MAGSNPHITLMHINPLKALWTCHEKPTACLYDKTKCVKFYLSPDARPPCGTLPTFAGLLCPGAGFIQAVLFHHWLTGAADAGDIAASEALPTGSGALGRKGMQGSN